MRALVWVSAIIVLSILQVSLMPLIAFKGVKPDLLLIFVTCAGMLFGKEKGVGIGFFGGLMQDIFLEGFFGFNILTKMFLGYFFGLAEHKVFKESILLPIVAVFGASIFSVAATIAATWLNGCIIDIYGGVLYFVWPFLLYNLLFAIPIHRIVFKIGSLYKQ